MSFFTYKKGEMHAEGVPLKTIEQELSALSHRLRREVFTENVKNLRREASMPRNSGQDF